MDRFFGRTCFAFAAQPEYSEMVHVRLEPVLGFKFFGERGERVMFEFSNFMTIAADEMMVMRMAMQFIFDVSTP